MKVTERIECPTCHRPADRIQSPVLDLDAYENVEVTITNRADVTDFVARHGDLIFIGDGVVKTSAVTALIDRLNELTRWPK